MLFAEAAKAERQTDVGAVELPGVEDIKDKTWNETQTSFSSMATTAGASHA